MSADTRHSESKECGSMLQCLSVGGQRILHNDDRHTLIIHGRLFHLPPYVYRACLPLLKQRERWERGQAPLWISAAALLAQSGITDPDLLRRHVNRANAELEVTGICFVRISASDGHLYQALWRERDVVRWGGRAG